MLKLRNPTRECFFLKKVRKWKDWVKVKRRKLEYKEKIEIKGESENLKEKVKKVNLKGESEK